MATKAAPIGAVQNKQGTQLSPQQAKLAILSGIAVVALSFGLGIWGMTTTKPLTAGRIASVLGFFAGAGAGSALTLYGWSQHPSKTPPQDPDLINATEMTTHKA